MFGIRQGRETSNGSSSTSSASDEVKDRRAVSDTAAARIDVTEKLTKRNLLSGGATSSPAKDKAGKGLLRLRRKRCARIIKPEDRDLAKNYYKLGLIKFC